MAIGRPMPPLLLDDTERETLERWVRRPKTAQGPGAAGQNDSGLRRRSQQQRSGCRLGGVRRNGGEVAFPVLGTAIGRPVGLAPQRPTASGYC